MRRPAALLLLAALAAAEDDPLKRVVEPKAVSLAPVEWGRYRKLGETERLRAKGLDPATWLRPFEAPPLDWAERKYGLQPGFRFDERLDVKRRIATRLLEGKDARVLDEVVRRIGEEWRRFEDPVVRLEEALRQAAPGGSYRTESGDFGEWLEKNKSRFARLQAQLALRRSELDFLDWFAREAGARFAGDDVAADVLAKGLASGSPRVRLFCAGALAEGGRGAVLRDAVAHEPDASVAARMVASLARADASAPAALLEDPRWQVRATVIEAVGRLATPEACDLLRGRLLLEDGRLADDIRTALGASAPPAREARVDFFGIGTRSRRVVFCLDISPSMAMAFDQRGAPVPRFEMARRELKRTLENMAEDVHFGIVTFHGRPARWRPGLLPATAGNKAAARALLDEIRFDDMGTNLVDAILECLDGVGSPAEPFDADTVYVLSDGTPSMGPLIDTHDVVAELAVRLDGRRVVVHAVGISTDQNGELMANLARVTGGRYVDFRE